MNKNYHNKKIEFTHTPNLASRELPVVRSAMLKLVSGFTLVETLVAISILSLSILAGFTAVQNSLKSSITAKDQMTAFYLTQEAMEFIKNRRDENALYFITNGSRTWLTGMAAVAGDPCYFGKTCRIDSSASTIVDCATDGGTCSNLRQDTVINSSTKGLYGYTGGWTATNFRRSITFQQVIPGQEISVTVTIRWTQGVLTKTFQITQSIFNRLQ